MFRALCEYFIRGIVNHGMYERYHHDVIGVNSRLDSLQAAVLRAKLPHLDGYCDRRREAARYITKLSGGTRCSRSRRRYEIAREFVIPVIATYSTSIPSGWEKANAMAWPGSLQKRGYPMEFIIPSPCIVRKHIGILDTRKQIFR